MLQCTSAGLRATPPKISDANNVRRPSHPGCSVTRPELVLASAYPLIAPKPDRLSTASLGRLGLSRKGPHWGRLRSLPADSARSSIWPPLSLSTVFDVETRETRARYLRIRDPFTSPNVRPRIFISPETQGIADAQPSFAHSKWRGAEVGTRFGGARSPTQAN
jgi:hypothetical protein